MDPEIAQLYKAFVRFKDWELGPEVKIINEAQRAAYRREAILEAHNAAEAFAHCMKGKTNEVRQC